MKITRSSKCYFNKWLTSKKKEELNSLLKEYSNIVNWFINTYENDIPENRKFDLLKAEHIQKCIKITNTRLTARLIKNAFSEGYGMIQSAKSNSENKGKYFSPKHYGNKMILSETIATHSDSEKTRLFDFNLTLKCLSTKQKGYKISIPLKKHKQFNKWNALGQRNKSITLTKDYILFSFDIETGKKKEEGKNLGIDLGINKLLTDNEGNIYGEKYQELLKKLQRRKQKSKAWYKTKEEVKEYIDSAIKQIPYEKLKLLVVEKLKNVKYKMKERKRLSKSVRFFVSSWTYRYILTRLQQQTEINRVSFRSVPSYNTSRECSVCGFTDKINRQSQEIFKCQKCGHADNADINAAKNILSRFIMGKYGSHYKSENVTFCNV